MSLYLGNNLISGNKPINLGVRNIGEIFPALLPVTDAGAHLLDGSLILGGGIYQGFVDYIANIVSIYPDVFTTESAWQQSVSTYGVCGKFVYDSTNNTVRLPKITGIIEGTTDVSALGDLVEAGLPNITGEIHDSWNRGVAFHGTNDIYSGAMYVNQSDTPSRYAGGYSDSNVAYKFGIDASRSNPIYGNSTTVQPQAIKCFIYIVIATSSKTEIQTDIDEVVTDLNGKADTDLSNINASQSAKNEIISWGMPDYDNGIAIGSANKYEALVDGYYVGKASASSGDVRLLVTLYDNSNTIILNEVGNFAYSNGGSLRSASITLPVPKGYKITVGGVIGTLSISSFYPMKGAN